MGKNKQKKNEREYRELLNHHELEIESLATKLKVVENENEILDAKIENIVQAAENKRYTRAQLIQFIKDTRDS